MIKKWFILTCVQALSVLSAVTAGPLAPGRYERSAQQQQEVELLEVTTDQEAEAEQSARLTARDPATAAAIANVLAIAGAGPSPLTGSGGYGGKRSADPQQEEAEQQPEEEEEPGHALSGRVSVSAIARILAAAGAEPTPLDPNPDQSYNGRRRREAEAASSVLSAVSVAAVKVRPHGAQGSVVQQHDGDMAVQTSVHSARFGRARRQAASPAFIPFHVYDERRVKTLKVEENDFLALSRAAAQQQERNKRKHSA